MTLYLTISTGFLKRHYRTTLRYPRSNLARAAASRSIRDVVFCAAPKSTCLLTTDKVGMGDAGGGAPQPTAEAALAVLRLLDAIPIAPDVGFIIRMCRNSGR